MLYIKLFFKLTSYIFIVDFCIYHKMYVLKCNSIKCQKPIYHIITYTSCGHIFCDNCGSLINQMLKCIACNQKLKKTNDILFKDTRRSIDLTTIRPHIVIDQVRKAINFWAFQINEELCFKTQRYNKLVEASRKEVETLYNQLDFLNSEVKSHTSKLDELEKERIRERENYIAMEKKCEEKNMEVCALKTKNENIKYEISKRNDSTK